MNQTVRIHTYKPWLQRVEYACFEMGIWCAMLSMCRVGDPLIGTGIDCDFVCEVSNDVEFGIDA